MLLYVVFTPRRPEAALGRLAAPLGKRQLFDFLLILDYRKITEQFSCCQDCSYAFLVEISGFAL